MYGGGFMQGRNGLKRDADSEWGLVSIFGFGKILGFQVSVFYNLRFMEIVRSVMQFGTESDFTWLFVLSWGIWFRRNKMQMEQMVLDPMDSAGHALSLHKAFSEVNIDGAIFSDKRKASVGVVLRDTHGKIVMVATKVEFEVERPTTIELLAVLRGLQLCLPLGIPNLVVESDCLPLVQQLQANVGGEDSYTPNGNLIAEARQLLSQFQQIQVVHVSRWGNGVAHTLARHA
ncbi:uncharacterized protein LOC121255128 [Juglans microcarpa x Juglans regia]|uniref:uncharacterized protein LOC121255128 n=1 Tax=Juglans microcarpa x Juglans regia TaxID=2249226 RepID=UPI001B7DFA6C|nr:uncharacterized protein LOC121255128 [Juglans microcarpa x Juglans regia]